MLLPEHLWWVQLEGPSMTLTTSFTQHLASWSSRTAGKCLTGWVPAVPDRGGHWITELERTLEASHSPFLDH